MHSEGSPHRLLCVLGSLRSTSYCFATAAFIQETAKDLGFTVEIIDPRVLDLPIYHPDKSIAEYGPASERVQSLIEAFRNAEAMIWISPTYHGTVSGAFKNQIDFAEYLAQDEAPYFQGKPVGLISINDSTTFAAMRDCARELRAWLAPTHIELSQEDFSEDLTLSKDRSRNRIKRLLTELQTFLDSHKSFRHKTTAESSSA